MFLLILLILNCLYGLSAMENVTCGKKHTFLETKGEAIFSVFVGANYGPYCNDSSSKGHQQVSTALHVIQTLNKNSYVPGLLLGLKAYDTCQDKLTVYKQALMAAVESECAAEYEFGILIPESYKVILKPFKEYSLLPISTYETQNLAIPLIDIAINFLSTKYEVVDLVLTNSQYILSHFLDASKQKGLCVESYSDFTKLENKTEAIIVAVGGKNDIGSWIQKSNREDSVQRTWFIVPTDDANIDDLIPEGSFVINTESFTSNLDDVSLSSHLESPGEPLIHSPHLLGIGKAIIEIAHVLQGLQRRTCPPGSTCALPHFDPKLREDISVTEIYEILEIPPKSQYLKYLIQQNINQEFPTIATYRINPETHKITPEKQLPKMPRLCSKNDPSMCQMCANFQEKTVAHELVRIAIQGSLLKPGAYIPIYLTIMVSGTFACLVIFFFIIYRYYMEEVLDGNPSLTLVLIIGTVFTLQTILPFCIDDEYMGREHLNSRKIFVSTLAFGLLFSTMLARAFFLAFSVGGIFTAHINGYLQSLMVFFMFSVQIAISSMYFALSNADSSVVMRSLTYISLLGYDIFLLVCLLIVSCFITQIQRNYSEGKCFFATVIGILVVWAVWVTCFILMEPAARDIIVCFGIIATAYLIIIGILIPRTYYMVTHLSREKNVMHRFEPADLGPDPRMNTMARQALDLQSRPSYYEYVRPSMDAANNGGNLRVARYPNCYTSVSPYFKHNARNRSPIEPRRNPGYNNHGFSSEMREVENNAYVVPRVCIESPQDRRSPLNNVDSLDVSYAHPRNPRRPKMFSDENDCIETDIYVEGQLHPNKRGPNENYPSRPCSPRLGQAEVTIREEDEDEITRITRF
ncbi:protein bride of sevenless isoform X2 [Belonocnema kinseyi]|uniref:protein bride of sevenless isoform X2 n=1 Tax=Belonocnema kinseyi TaxID=2817044 RepID=UPI00143DF973|nr:protein bride of sevenless isoform X2 [Belonocnema kinseyi]